MKLVILLLSLQTGYNIAKTIDYKSLCEDSPENDPRLKRSEEKVEPDAKEDTKEQDLDQLKTRRTFFKVSNGKNENIYNFEGSSKDYAKDKNGELAVERNNNSNKLTSDPVLEILPTINDQKSLKNIDANTKKINHINSPQYQPVIIQKIDPRFILISKPYKPNKDYTTNNKYNIDVEKSEAAANNLVSNNSSKPTNISELNVNKTVDGQIVYEDVANIREIREHLLDHLLDYFINIIKEEQYTDSDARKKINKNTMKFEERLRNYYDPHHLDMLLDEQEEYDSDYDENDFQPSDYRRNDNGDNLLKPQHNLSSVNDTKIDPSITNVFVDGKTVPENYNDLNKTRNLKDKQNASNSIPDIETLYMDFPEPSSVASKYINYIENENSTNFINSSIDTGKIESSYINNDTTRELGPSAIKSEANNFDLSPNLDDEDDIEYIIDSDEFNLSKNFSSVEVEKNYQNKNVNKKESGRNEDISETDLKINNKTQFSSYKIGKDNIQDETATNKLKNVSTNSNKDFLSENSKLELEKTKIDYDNTFNDNAIAENKNKHIPSKKIKQNEGVNGTSNNFRKGSGYAVVKNNIKINELNKSNCRKTIVLNLNINLI